jgi:hypothetical protein
VFLHMHPRKDLSFFLLRAEVNMTIVCFRFGDPAVRLLQSHLCCCAVRCGVRFRLLGGHDIVCAAVIRARDWGFVCCIIISDSVYPGTFFDGRAWKAMMGS